jgi:hypothetical protein
MIKLKRKNIIPILIFAICLILQSFSFQAKAQPIDKAKDAANSTLKKYSTSLKWSDYNFSNQQEFDNATVGQGLPVYNFDAEKLAQGAANIQDTMYDTNKIEYTVVSNSKYVTRITMKKNGDSYIFNKIGGKGENLSNGINSLNTFKKGTSDKFDIARIVKLGPATFLYVKLNEIEKIIYTDDVPLDGIKSLKPYNVDEIIPILQQFSKGMINSTTSTGLGRQDANNKNRFSPVVPVISVITVITLIVMLSYLYKNKICK